uniref:Uncharacterized protein n=1 Tax=Siphoviridae sp. ctzO58 TaxID=2825748 RepID=A0A8S5UWN6_9CAUD|nr:MAG TPA: hypothetical protein [Siphoviridae sp. ctzO58]DAM99355.1 MAG TPA: hypothetical protein [Caudoviricetes sp.]
MAAQVEAVSEPAGSSVRMPGFCLIDNFLYS